MYEVKELNFLNDGRLQTSGDRMQTKIYKRYLLLYHAEAALQSIVTAAAMLFPCDGMYIDL